MTFAAYSVCSEIAGRGENAGRSSNLTLMEAQVAYVEPNFKSKKELKAAVAAGQRVSVFSPGPFGCKQHGTEYIEGPHYPEPHRWYAQVEVKDGLVVKVKG